METENTESVAKLVVFALDNNVSITEFTIRDDDTGVAVRLQIEREEVRIKAKERPHDVDTETRDRVVDEITKRFSEQTGIEVHGLPGD